MNGEALRRFPAEVLYYSCMLTEAVALSHELNEDKHCISSLRCNFFSIPMLRVCHEHQES